MANTDTEIMNKKLQELLDRSLTGVRTIFISDTVARTGLNGMAIKAIEDTVIAEITYVVSPTAASNTLDGETILAGDIWYLNNIKSIRLTSGALFVYIH